MIVCDPDLAEARHHDVAVIGGGIMGAAVLHEAASRGLSACLFEAEDFGGGTTWNSLRILHGGLRYLQSASLRRFRESVAARRSIAMRFPALVRPLECLMPLYGVGLKRRSTLRAALACNDLLSADGNRGVRPELRLARGRVLDVGTTLRTAPAVRRERLQGAAVWYDHRMLSSERIVIELLHQACRRGAVAVNYAPVQALLTRDRTVTGFRYHDPSSGRTGRVTARSIIDCTGARIGLLGRDARPDLPECFIPSLAFNVMLDLTLDSECALAVAAPDRGSPVFFLVPQQRGTLAGTMHVPRDGGTVRATPTDAEIDEFVCRLDRAIPSLGLRRRAILAVSAGLLPVRSAGSVSLELRESIVAHDVRGLEGYYTVSGVKFTTAVVAAHRVVSAIEPSRNVSGPRDAELPVSSDSDMLTDADRFLNSDSPMVAALLRRVVAAEAVRSIDDLVLRRTNWLSSGHDRALLCARVAAHAVLPLT